MLVPLSPFDDDFDIPVEHGEKTEKPVGRKPLQTAAHQRGDLRLIDFEQRGGLFLRQPPFFENLADPIGNLGLCILFLGIGKIQIREYIPATFPDLVFGVHDILFERSCPTEAFKEPPQNNLNNLKSLIF